MSRIQRLDRAAALALFLVVASCSAAAPNPTATGLPSAWKPLAVKSEPETQAVKPAVTAAATAPATEKPVTAGMKVDEAPMSSEPIVARVAGRPVYVSELLTQWMYLDPMQVKEQIDELALGRLFVAEATRLAVVIDPDRRSRAYEEAAKGLEDQIAKNRPGMTLDRYVDRVLGLDPIRYRERLRDEALRHLLGQRVMRAWLLSTEHALVRIVIVKTEDEMKAVQADLAASVPFEEIAKKRSADSVSAKDGGRMPPIVKGNTPMGRLAFETKAGEVASPSYNEGEWLFLKVDARPTPLVGDWSKIGSAVEASLEASRIDSLELAQWRSAMLARYEVDLKPFLELVGQPGR